MPGNENPRSSLLPMVVVAVLIAGGVGGWRAWELSRDATDDDAREFRVDPADAPAPALDLEAIGGRFNLGDTKGKLVFINFWATWCPPCRDELPSMVGLGKELTERYPGRFKMVAVSVDDDWETVVNFFRGPPPPWLTVARDASQDVTRSFYCTARGQCPDSFKFPETYIVDGRGRLVAYVVGPRDWSSPAIRRYLGKLIEG
ncbi:MAG TPA: TlpA disulfide reductase family protein [Anaeromyxobacteraceae bacterium]|nr:TlpA disulfide reductase family protein [Anaeromyxobacteraceae bacterium]